MKTKDLLIVKEAELSSELKKMKLKELEKHAKNITSSLGGSSYDELMAELIKIIPTLSQADTQEFSDKKDSQNNLTSVRDHLKNSVGLATNDSNEDQDKLTRLTVILMLIISKKFNSILKST